MKRLLLAAISVAAMASPAAAQVSEFRIGPNLLSGRRLQLPSGGGNVVQVSEGLKSAELLWRGLGAGIFLRAFSGDYAPTLSDLVELDARLLMGPRPFTLEFGYGQRGSGFSFPADSGFRYGRGGVRSTWVIGTSGFQAWLGGGVYLSPDKSDNDKIKVAGWDAETSVIYQVPRGIPLYGLLGFRFERISSAFGEGNAEEISGVLIGAGLRFASPLTARP